MLSTLANIARGAYRPLPPHLSPPLRDLVAGLLQVDPARRLTLAAARRHPWLAAHGQGVPPVVDAAGEAASTAAAAAEQEPQPMLVERSVADGGEAATAEAACGEADAGTPMARSTAAAAGMEPDCAAPQQQRFSFHHHAAPHKPTPATPRISLAATAAPAALHMTAGSSSSSGSGASPAAPAAPEPAARPRAAGFFCARLLGLFLM